MAHGTYDNPRVGSNGSKDRMKNLTDKVLVSKTKRSGKDLKFKKVSSARAERMKKRGWKSGPLSKVDPGSIRI